MLYGSSGFAYRIAMVPFYYLCSRMWNLAPISRCAGTVHHDTLLLPIRTITITITRTVTLITWHLQYIALTLLCFLLLFTLFPHLHFYLL